MQDYIPIIIQIKGLIIRKYTEGEYTNRMKRKWRKRYRDIRCRMKGKRLEKQKLTNADPIIFSS